MLRFGRLPIDTLRTGLISADTDTVVEIVGRRLAGYFESCLQSLPRATTAGSGRIPCRRRGNCECPARRVRSDANRTRRGIERLRCKILYESRSAQPKMLSGVDIASEEDAFAYGKQIRLQLENGNWERAPENGIVVAERTTNDSAQGLLSENAAARAEPRTFPEFTSSTYGQAKSRAPIPTAITQDESATEKTQHPIIDFQKVERAHQEASKSA